MLHPEITLNELTQWCVYRNHTHASVKEVYAGSLLTFQRLMHKNNTQTLYAMAQEPFALIKPHVASFVKEDATHRTLWGHSRAAFFLRREDYSFLDTPDCITRTTLRLGGCSLMDLPPLGSVTDRRHKRHRRHLQFLFDYYGVKRVYALSRYKVLSPLLNDLVAHYPHENTTDWDDHLTHLTVDTLMVSQLVMKTRSLFSLPLTLEVLLDEMYPPHYTAYRRQLKDSVEHHFHHND